MIRKIASVLLLILVIAVSLSAQSRFALVIGNSNYAGLGSLKNPVNDATDVAKAFEILGFSVQLLTDADLIDMEDAVSLF